MSERLILEQDPELEALLKGHLERCLAGQVGRARVAFAQELRLGRRRWAWLSTAAAVAAGLAIAWAMFGNRAGPLNAPPDVEEMVHYPPSMLGPTPVVQGASWTGFKDAGTVVVQDQPMRRWKRTVLEEYQYYDADTDAVVRTRAPREQVYFIGMETD
jgi:hypothetical protein